MVSADIAPHRAIEAGEVLRTRNEPVNALGDIDALHSWIILDRGITAAPVKVVAVWRACSEPCAHRKCEAAGQGPGGQ